MAGYSAMKYCMEKNNLHYFTYSPNSERSIKAVIPHLPPNTPVKNISKRLEVLAFNVINVRQMTATRRAPKGQIHVEPIHLFLVTLTRNIKSREIFKLNTLNHIIIRLALRNAISELYNCWGSAVVSYCCEELVAEAGGSSGTQRKGNARRWKRLPSNVQRRHVRRSSTHCSDLESDCIYEL
jgi:hypothetical protein